MAPRRGRRLPSCRPLADLLPAVPLPAGTDSVSVPRLTTGSSVAVQTADNAAVAEVDPVDAAVVAPVRTLAGHVDVAVQLADQGGPPGFDRMVFGDLAAAYNTSLSTQIIAGSGASGQVAGFLTSPGTTVTYTSLTPTVAATFSKIGDLASQVATARQRVPTGAVMHPRRAFWLMTQPDTQNRPMSPVDLAAPERDANVEPVGSLAGMALVLTTAMVTTTGAGTEGCVIVTNVADHLLLEGEPRRTLGVDLLSSTLTVRFGLHRFVAVITGRVPSSTGVLSGTGLAAPVFA